MSDAYSLADPRVLDRETRLAQAGKILSVVEHFAREQGLRLPPDARALDAGCSSGVITRALATRFGRAVGVDVDRHALLSECRAGTDTASFALASALALPFAANQFEFVLCNQVYQYVPDVARLLAEIERVLRPGWFCYFSARNLWGVLSRDNWLPLVAARAPGLAARLAGPLRAERRWRERAGTLWPYSRLRAVAARYFVVHDYSTRVLGTPALAAGFAPGGARWLRRLPPPALAALKPLLPTQIWILQKR